MGVCAGDAETVLTLVRQGGRVPVRPAQGEHCSVWGEPAQPGVQEGLGGIYGQGAG